MVDKQSFIALVRERLMLVKPLWIEVWRDNHCSLEHVVSEAGIWDAPLVSLLPVALSPSKLPALVCSRTPLPSSDESKDFSLDLCPWRGMLTSTEHSKSSPAMKATTQWVHAGAMLSHVISHCGDKVESVDHLLPVIAKIINLSLLGGYFGKAWKERRSLNWSSLQKSWSLWL